MLYASTELRFAHSGFIVTEFMCGPYFFGALATLRKVTMSFIISARLSFRPSVRPYGTALLPTVGFFMKVDI